MEFVQVSGLRLDGRRGEEVRRVECEMGLVGGFDGSARLNQGLTSIIATISGPKELRGGATRNCGIVKCEVAQAPFSTIERRKRRPGDKRSLAIARSVEDTFSKVIQTHLFPRTQIDITLHIVQVDGGLLSACINATTLALVHAGIPMVDMITACTVGYLDSNCILDLNHQEENAGAPELTLVLVPKTSDILSVTMGSNATRVNTKLMEELLRQANIGCQKISKILQSSAREYIGASMKEMSISGT